MQEVKRNIHIYGVCVCMCVSAHTNIYIYKKQRMGSKISKDATWMILIHAITHKIHKHAVRLSNDGDNRHLVFACYRNDPLASLSPLPFLSGGKDNSPFSRHAFVSWRIKRKNILTVLVNQAIYLSTNNNFVILLMVIYLSISSQCRWDFSFKAQTTLWIQWLVFKCLWSMLLSIRLLLSCAPSPEGKQQNLGRRLRR